MTNSLDNESAKLLAHEWGIAYHPGDTQDREGILEALTARVRFMIRHDFERLANAMYTLDVNEDQFRASFDGDQTAAAARIAQLILDREIAKAASRRAHEAAKRADSEKPGLPETDRVKELPE